MANESNESKSNPEIDNIFDWIYLMIEKKFQDGQVAEARAEFLDAGGTVKCAIKKLTATPEFSLLPKAKQEELIIKKAITYQAVLKRFDDLRAKGYYEPNQGRN
jgi:hypothetical protein